MRAFFEWVLDDASEPFGERFSLVVSTVLAWWRLDGVSAAIVTEYNEDGRLSRLGPTGNSGRKYVDQ